MGHAFFPLQMVSEDGMEEFLGVDVPFHQRLNLVVFKKLNAFLRHDIIPGSMDNAELPITVQGRQ